MSGLNDKVYVRRSRVDRTVDDRETNLDPPTFQNSLNNPSPMISEEVSESCHDAPHKKKRVGQHKCNEQSTPYPINKYVPHTKMSKNFKCFISTMINNVIPRSLIVAQYDF